MENEINKTISFIIEAKHDIALEINLTKDVKKLLHWKYNTLLKIIKEDLNKWRGILFSYIRKLTVVKMSLLSMSINNSTQYHS